MCNAASCHSTHQGVQAPQIGRRPCAFMKGARKTQAHAEQQVARPRLRTMAFRLAIFRVPRARQVVTTAGSPSGMAATASATAILK